MKWAHLLCAMWIPEVSLGNATFQEPVQDVEKVPKTRWKLVSMHRALVLLLPDRDYSRVTSASKEWEHVYSVGTSHASKHSMSPVLAELDCAYA
jgi:hypothetical protein